MIYEEIANFEINIPDFLNDKPTLMIIKQLLNKKPELRLGSNYSELKYHIWFYDFDWH